MKLYILEVGKESHYAKIEDIVKDYVFPTLEEAEEAQSQYPDLNKPKIKEIEL